MTVATATGPMPYTGQRAAAQCRGADGVSHGTALKRGADKFVNAAELGFLKTGKFDLCIHFY